MLDCEASHSRRQSPLWRTAMSSGKWTRRGEVQKGEVEGARVICPGCCTTPRHPGFTEARPLALEARSSSQGSLFESAHQTHIDRFAVRLCLSLHPDACWALISHLLIVGPSGLSLAFLSSPCILLPFASCGLCSPPLHPLPRLLVIFLLFPPGWLLSSSSFSLNLL